MDRRGLERFVLRQCRQQPRQPLRQHRFAGARWALASSRLWPAGGGDLECAFRERLTADVAEVGKFTARRAPPPRRSAAATRVRRDARRPRASWGPGRRRHRAPARLRARWPRAGQKRALRRCALSVIASAPRIGRSSPVSANSPANSWVANAVAGICPVAARIPSAIGRSKRPDSLGRSAGARLAVILRAGNSKWAFCSAARTRSRLSLTSVSGRPDKVECGQAAGEMHLDRNGRRVEAGEGA